MNKGEKMKAPTKDDIREQLLTYKNKLKQAEHEIECLKLDKGFMLDEFDCCECMGEVSKVLMQYGK